MYCCDQFENSAKFKDKFSPNIRIVKYNSDFLIKGSGIDIIIKGKIYKRIKGSNTCYRYYIGLTTDSFSLDSSAFLLINFCPFCGKGLYEYYNKDEYVNEIEGDTFLL